MFVFLSETEGKTAFREFFKMDFTEKKKNFISKSLRKTYTHIYNYIQSINCYIYTRLIIKELVIHNTHTHTKKKTGY